MDALSEQTQGLWPKHVNYFAQHTLAGELGHQHVADICSELIYKNRVLWAGTLHQHQCNLYIYKIMITTPDSDCQFTMPAVARTSASIAACKNTRLHVRNRINSNTCICCHVKQLTAVMSCWSADRVSPTLASYLEARLHALLGRQRGEAQQPSHVWTQTALAAAALVFHSHHGALVGCHR